MEEDRAEERSGGKSTMTPAPDAWLGPFLAEKVRILATVGGSILVLDLATKWLVQETFFLGQSRAVLGSVFRLTYIVNPGAAFGFQVGEHSRLIFTVLGTGVLLLLFALYRRTPLNDRFRLHALALVSGGALGNLLDRVTGTSGVVDFFDLGFGGWRFPIFNIADIAITIGAILLAVSFWQEDGARAEEGGETRENGEAESDGVREPTVEVSGGSESDEAREPTAGESGLARSMEGDMTSRGQDTLNEGRAPSG